MSIVLDLLVKHWKSAALVLIVAAVAVWIEVLRIERDDARAQLADYKAKVTALAASVTAQNAAVDQWQKTAKDAQERAATALKEVQGRVDAWQTAAHALAAYKRSPQIVTKYQKVKVTNDECRIAKGMAQSAWADAQRVRKPNSKGR